MSKEIDLLITEVNISKILFNYAKACDEKNWPLLDDVFHESAIAIYGDHQCTGLNEIKSFLSESLRSIGDAQHLLTNIQIEVNEDNASSTSYLSALQMINDINPMPSQVWGQYKDNLIRDNGVWKITRKELKIFFSS
jgi:hypothetical protein|tara:strand:+ start:1524 stop:1934 length:411 start_codon:yes stop_codon:yes gene_type:complete